MTTATHDRAFRGTLTDLRGKMVRRVSWVALLACALPAYATLLTPQFDSALFAMTLAGLVAVFGLRALIPVWQAGARYGLIVLLHGLLLATQAHTGAEWLLFAAVALVLITGMISSAAHWFSALVVLAAGVAAGLPPERLLALAFTLGLASAAMGVSIATWYTAVRWYSSMQNRADALLEETRQRQAELAQTVKSLEIAYQNVRRLGVQLAAAKREADEARKLKERFAANISHELRTPLNLILGFSEIMTLTPEVYGEGRLPLKLARDLYQIYSSSRHLLALIDDVLDLSQIALSSFALNLERTDAAAFMAETSAMCANLFRDGRLTFEAIIEPGLPDIEIDRTRIRQVLLNLLSNAHRFTESGSVTVRAFRRGGGVAFSVADTGRGIPADKLARVFDEFYQVDYSLSRQHGGAGLGLAICKHFVERHGGTIEVESAVAVGSTFTFTLPARGAASGAAPADPAQPQNASVLVIDRDPLVGSLIRRYVAPAQVVQIDDAARLDDAIDLHMPAVVVINGTTPAPALPIPTIRCALPSASDMLNELNVQGFLPKPFTTAQLAEIIRIIGGADGVRRILIVDDDLGFVQLVGRGLETLRRDLTLLAAYDGAQALTLIRDASPDLVLLDLVMPEMDGFALIAAVRALPRMNDLPIVLITATRYAREAEALGPLTLDRAGGLRPAEVLTAVRALVAALPRR